MEGRPTDPQSADMLVLERLILNRATGEAWRDGTPLGLSATERRLLVVLLAHADATVSTADLIHAVWGTVSPSSEAYLDLYIHHLQQKLEANPATPRLVRAERGGYRFVTAVPPSTSSFRLKPRPEPPSA